MAFNAIAGQYEYIYSNNERAFLRYSARNWAAHLREADITDDDIILPFAVGICDPDSKSYSKWSENYWTEGRGDAKCFTDLMVAAYFSHYALVKLLLHKGADVEAKNEFGETSLLLAAKGGHDAIVKLLLNKGAKVKVVDREGRRSLSLAAEQGHEATVELLLHNGANIETKEQNGYTALSLAAEGGHTAVVKLLLGRAANIEGKDKFGWTPLSLAASKGHEATVELLLDYGANVEAMSKYYQTPLSIAASEGHEAVVKLLRTKTPRPSPWKTSYRKGKSPSVESISFRRSDSRGFETKLSSVQENNLHQDSPPSLSLPPPPSRDSTTSGSVAPIPNRRNKIRGKGQALPSREVEATSSGDSAESTDVHLASSSRTMNQSPSLKTTGIIREQRRPRPEVTCGEPVSQRTRNRPGRRTQPRQYDGEAAEQRSEQQQPSQGQDRRSRSYGWPEDIFPNPTVRYISSNSSIAAQVGWSPSSQRRVSREGAQGGPQTICDRCSPHPRPSSIWRRVGRRICIVVSNPCGIERET
jgi:ankyrin repeat protein